MLALLLISFSVYPQNVKVQEFDNELEYQILFDKSMKDSVSCYRIPAIITAPNGDIIAAIDERVPSCGDLKWSKDINIVIRRSRDNGETWTDIETIVDFPFGQSASDPSLIVDKVTGEVFMFYNYMDLDREKDVYYLQYVKSSDNGKTWSKPVDITSQITKPEWYNDFKFITSGRGIQTRSGKLLHTMVNLDNGMHLFASDDHGNSWYLIDTPIKPANESKVIELADGSWMINSRVNGGGLRYVHTSTDEGKTWTSVADSNLIDPGCNASIIRYGSINDGDENNMLVFSNAKMEKGRENMTVRLSYDEGKTWTEGKTIYTGSSAYSSMTVLKNGDIGLFFEKDDYSENVFVKVSLDWLKEKKSKVKLDEFRKINDNLYLLWFNKYGCKSVITEFDDYLAVVEFPRDSIVANLIIEKAKQEFPNKPIKYVFHSHHHPHAAASFDPFLKLTEANLVTSDYNYQKLKKLTKDTIGLENRYIKNDSVFTLNSDSNQLVCYSVKRTDYPVSTKEYNMIWLPKQQTIVSGCLYQKPLEYHQVVNPRKVALRDFIKDYNLDVKYIIPTNTCYETGYEDICTRGMMDSTFRFGVKPELVADYFQSKSMEYLKWATDSLKQEIGKIPSYYDYYQCAKELKRREAFERALVILNLIPEVYEELSHNVYVHAGDCYKSLGEKQKAKAYYEKYISCAVAEFEVEYGKEKIEALGNVE